MRGSSTDVASKLRNTARDDYFKLENSPGRIFLVGECGMNHPLGGTNKHPIINFQMTGTLVFM